MSFLYITFRELVHNLRVKSNDRAPETAREVLDVTFLNQHLFQQLMPLGAEGVPFIERLQSTTLALSLARLSLSQPRLGDLRSFLDRLPNSRIRYLIDSLRFFC